VASSTKDRLQSHRCEQQRISHSAPTSRAAGPIGEGFGRFRAQYSARRHFGADRSAQHQTAERTAPRPNRDKPLAELISADRAGAQPPRTFHSAVAELQSSGRPGRSEACRPEASYHKDTPTSTHHACKHTPLCEATRLNRAAAGQPLVFASLEPRLHRVHLVGGSILKI